MWKEEYEITLNYEFISKNSQNIIKNYFRRIFGVNVLLVLHCIWNIHVHLYGYLEKVNDFWPHSVLLWIQKLRNITDDQQSHQQYGNTKQSLIVFGISVLVENMELDLMNSGTGDHYTVLLLLNIDCLCLTQLFCSWLENLIYMYSLKFGYIWWNYQLQRTKMHQYVELY